MFGSTGYRINNRERHYWRQYRCETQQRKLNGCYGQWCYSADRIESRVLEEIEALFKKVLTFNAVGMKKIIESHMSSSASQMMHEAALRLADAKANVIEMDKKIIYSISSGNQDEVDALNKQLPTLRMAVDKAEKDYSCRQPSEPDSKDIIPGHSRT